MQAVKKIVVIGPESTGKSTLSAALAQHYNTVWVPEYARAYLEQLGRAYNESDLLKMAQGQLQQEDDLSLQADRLLICDTDLNVIKVWSEAKYESCDRWILEQIALRQYDMYVLTDIDMQWEDDPLREHGLPEERHYFYAIYKDIVQQSGLPWISVSGTETERLHTATNAIDTLLNL